MGPRDRLAQRVPMAILALCLALAVGACGPGADEDEQASAPPERQRVAAEPTVGPEKVTLNLSDHLTGGTQNEWLDAQIARFQERYPQVRIRRNQRSFGDDVRTQRLALSGGKGPDIAQVANGWSGMGPLVRAGLLVNLDPYAKQWGWDERFTPESRAGLSFTEDGRTFGQGSLYGAPTEIALTGVYYNRAKLRELGVGYPKTLAEFEQVLERAKAAGEVPIQGGDLDKWPFLHVAYQVINQFQPPKAVNDWVFKRGGASLETPATVEAARTLQRWAQRDYFAPGFLGKSYDDGNADFAKGEGVFHLTGSWMAGQFEQELGEDVGFAGLPPREAGGPVSTTGSFGNPFAINAKSKHRDVAAAFLDFVTRPEAQQANAEAGQIPAFTQGVQVKEGTLLADLVAVQQQATRAQALTDYMDFATPTMLDTFQEAVQRLLAGRMTPEEFVREIQSEQAEFRA